MFCRKCGAECKDEAKFCPKCGASLKLKMDIDESEIKKTDIPDSDFPQKSNDSGGEKKHKFHWWIIIVVAVIVVVIIILARFLPNSPSTGDYTIDTGENVTALGEGFTNRKISSGESAVLAAQDVAEDLEYKNAFDDLSLYNESSTDGRCYYRLQQNYEGIQVYQRYTIVVTSEDGEPLALYTDAVDVEESLSLTPTITYEDAVESINEYAANNWDAVYDDMTISELSNESLVIYTQNDSVESCLGYALTVENDDIYTVVLNADTGEVLDCVSDTSDIAATGTNTDGNLEFPVEYNELDDIYIICDPSRNIYVYNLKEALGKRSNIDFNSLSQPESAGNNIFGDTQGERENDVDKAINLYTNVNGIIDFYKTFNQDIPYKHLTLCYNDGVDNGKNAYAGPIKREEETAGRLSIGYIYDGTETDILAHEFTHLVQYELDAAIGSGCDYGIIEGLADTFSCFYTGTWDIDLTKAGLAHRNAEDPSAYNYPTTVSDPNESKEKDGHAYATVLSHAAFLMNDSNLFSNDYLEELWYETLLILPTNCSYEDFYVCMRNTANTLGFSSEQKEVISNILFELGFDKEETTDHQDDIDGDSTSAETFRSILTKHGCTFDSDSTYESEEGQNLIINGTKSYRYFITYYEFDTKKSADEFYKSDTDHIKENCGSTTKYNTNQCYGTDNILYYFISKDGNACICASARLEDQLEVETILKDLLAALDNNPA